MPEYKVMKEYKKSFEEAFKKIYTAKYKLFAINFVLMITNNLFSENTQQNEEINIEVNQAENGNVNTESSQKFITNQVKKERGVEKMNFYIPVDEQNKFSTYGEIDYRQDKNIYKYTLGEGYIGLNRNWDFNYKVMREFQRYKEHESASNDSNSWDNEIYFSRKNKNFKIGKREFGSNFVLGMKHTENSTKITENTRDYKFYLGQKISTSFPSLGRGGTFMEYGLTLNGVHGSIRNGYSVLGTINSSTLLGYGFQWSNSLEGEYMDYNDYKGNLRGKYETVFRWTYELGKYFAFSPETTFKAEKYFKYKIDNLTLESSAGTYLLYSQNFTDKFRIYGKAGPLFRYEKTKYGIYKNKKSQLTGYAKIGLEYIF